MGGRFHGRNNPPKEKKPLKDTFDLKTLRMKFRAKIAAAMAVALAFATYEGWLAGGGVTYGYQWVLGRHWNAEAAVSVGYEHLRYKKFESPEECAPQVGERSHNYWGPTKLSASIIYIF